MKPYLLFFSMLLISTQEEVRGICEYVHERAEDFGPIDHREEREEHNERSIIDSRCYEGSGGYFTYWSDWGPCIQSCTGGGTQMRHRCYNNCGRPAELLDMKDVEERRRCGSGLSDWSDWGPCSQTCIGGKKMRYRYYDNCKNVPAAKQSRECGGGSYSDWSDWGPCSQTCIGGKQMRYQFHNCNLPKVKQSRDCGSRGSYSDWSNWGPCSQTCTGGKQMRYRSHNCIGSKDEQSRDCGSRGSYSDWSDWEPCSQTCIGGKQMRYQIHNCNLPKVKQARECGGGSYSDWSDWGPCSQTCIGGKQMRYQFHNCNLPKVKQSRDCGSRGSYSDWSNWGPCSQTCTGGKQMRYRSHNCIGSKDEQSRECGSRGSYSDWSDWGTCSQTCIGGKQMRYRFHNCDLPVDMESRVCGQPPTHGPWALWGPCSATCGTGTRSRRNEGKCGAENETQTETCTGKQLCCILDWTQWSSCSVTYFKGEQRRVRYLSCFDGTPIDTQIRECSAPPGPVELCTNNPCKNGGTCQEKDDKSGYDCLCDVGFKGINCDELDVRIDKVVEVTGAIVLRCICPKGVLSEILWTRNRLQIDQSVRWALIQDNGRKLTMMQAYYSNSGQYTCQFQYLGIEYKATELLIIKASPSIACGQSVGPNDPERKEIIGVKVLDGRNTKSLHAPFMAMLYKNIRNGHIDNKGIFCGGSIINTKNILTAAHCFHRVSYTDVTVYVGKLLANLNHIERVEQFSDIKNVTVHPSHDPMNLHADIAIITLKQEIYYSEGVKPICILDPSEEEEDLKPKASKGKKRIGIVYGWGITEKGEGANRLLEVDLPIVRKADCKKSYPGKITSLMFCVGGEQGRDSCEGDSGGPFTLWSSKWSKWFLAGIVSWGDKCGRSAKPGVYTRITPDLRKWIYGNTDLGA